ncbi:MAG TPA: ABC transporter permease [Pirellulales bacterium]|jgi:ABC-type multidrug transport system permease subunit|nr:ABC transporter permease [Pirellulales bacterium]
MNDSPRYWPLRQLIVARLREFYREPEAVFWVYGFPILMVVLLGIAFRNKPVQRVKVDVIRNAFAERAKSDLSKGSPGKEFDAEINDADSARLRLRTGKTDLIVLAPGGPAASASSSAAVAIQSAPHYEFFFDPSRPESVLARNTVDDALERAAGRKDIATVTDKPVDEPGSRYIDFLVPGLLGMGLMGGGLWGVGFVTVDMRIRKLLKRFLATPMKKSHFLAGIMISRLAFMVPEVLVLLLFSWLVFGVVIHGSLLAVVALILLGAGMFAGIGLLVASRARTLETVSGLMNLVMLPMWVLSGIFFSSERFPAAAQPFIKALPLTPLIDGLRAVMLEGSPLSAISRQLLTLAAWGILTFVLALRWFRWT